MDRLQGENSSERSSYSRLQVVLHWIIAALVLAQFLLHDGMEAAHEANMRDSATHFPQGMALVHATVGLGILLLTLLRFGLRRYHGAPEASEPVPTLVALAGHSAHLALYGFLFAMPVTGILAYGLRNDLAAELHEWLAFLLLWLVVGHVLGAFVEHALFRNRALLRMLVPDRTPSQ